MSPSPVESPKRRALTPPRLLGALLTFAAGVALVGWYLSSLRAVTLPDAMVSMQWSTAAGFLATGAALFARSLRRRRLAFLLGCMAAGVGSVALAESQLTSGWQRGATLVGVSMSPGTAIGLVLAAAFFIAFRSPRTRRVWRDGVTMVLAALLLAAGATGIVARVLIEGSAPGLSTLIQMEMPTALAFLGLGAAFFVMIGHFRDGLVDQRIPSWASWAAGLGVATLIVGIWVGLKSNEQTARLTAVAQTHDATLTHANRWMRARQRDAERLGALWKRLNSVERRSLHPDGAIFVEDMPALESLSWHESKGGVHSIWPPSASASEVAAGSRANAISARERAIRTGDVAASEPFPADTVDQRIAVSVPILRGPQVAGVLAFEYDAETFFAGAFGDGVARQTSIQLSLPNGRPFYTSRPPQAIEGGAESGTSRLPPSQIAFADRIWAINGSVDVRGVTGRSATSNTLLLWVGLFLAVAIAFVVRKSQLLRDKAHSLELAHGEVEDAAKELIRANQSLEKQRDSLRHTENQLRRAAREKRRVLDSLSAFLVGVDEEGVVTEWNSVSSEVFGLRSSETLGRRFRELPLAWDGEALEGAVREAVSSGQRIARDNYTVAGSDETGDRVVCFTVNPTLRQGVGGYAIIGSDVTERQLLEMQLHHAQKLESVGTLAAGIAHEINTPMQFVGDNVRFLSQSVEPITASLKKIRDMLADCEDAAKLRDEMTETIEELDVDFVAEEFPAAIRETLEGIDRVTGIVRAMKDFSHPGAEGCSLADLNKAIETTLAVARSEYKHHAVVETDFGDLPQVQCWVADLNQVFLNLLVNATHAIRDKLGEHSTDMGSIKIRTRQVGEEVEVRVTDTGGGIPIEAQAQVFNQFFTTKGIGEGTGLGLAICRGVVVDRHRGSIDFTTEAGKGTTFIVRVPISQEAEHEAHPVC